MAIAGLAKRQRHDHVVAYFGRGSYGPTSPLRQGDGFDEYLVPYDAQFTSTART
jgi:hypothetical protein